MNVIFIAIYLFIYSDLSIRLFVSTTDYTTSYWPRNLDDRRSELVAKSHPIRLKNKY